MKIILVVGKFPVLSETFIIRKAIFLASNNNEILILSRRKGDINILKSYGKIPSNLKFGFLIPEFGPYRIKELFGIAGQITKYLFAKPALCLKWYGIIRRKTPDFTWRSFVKYLAFIDKQDYDLIHFEFLNLSTRYSLIPSLLPCKLIASCRGADLHTLPIRSDETRISVGKTVEVLKAIHCVSDEMKRLFLEQFPAFDPDSVFVNRPAVDPALFLSVSARIKPGASPVILSTGRLEWKKGFDYLLEAYRILVEKGYRFQALILGEGSLSDELRFSISDLGLDNHVQLAGKVPPDQVIQRLQTADIFVLPSHEEGISNAVLEAMATGLPVVSTEVGGMAEAITHAEDGFLVLTRDPEALADKIALLLDDPGLRQRLGRKARQKVLENMTLQKQATIFETQYRRILDA